MNFLFFSVLMGRVIKLFNTDTLDRDYFENITSDKIEEII